MTNSHEQCLMANNQPILSFLEFSDLIQFQAVFQAFGVDKFEHLKDVEVDDLRKFGKLSLCIRFIKCQFPNINFLYLSLKP